MFEISVIFAGMLFNMIINVIIFQYEKWLWEYFQICKYAFFVILSVIIFFNVWKGVMGMFRGVGRNF